jgi:hypothetical protein
MRKNYAAGCSKLLTTILIGVILLSLHSPVPAQEWRPLFNGKNLDGWETYLGRPHRSVEGLELPKDDRGEYAEPVGLNKDPRRVFTVVNIDGAPAIRISGEIWGAITTQDEFENYHLRLEVKWGEKKWPPRANTVRDSGLLYHCVGPHGAGSGAWMQSFESQIQENDFGDFWSVAGVLVDVEGVQEPGRDVMYQRGGQAFRNWNRHIIRNPRSEKELGEWNTVELYAVGQTAAHVNNGKTNMVLTGLSRRVDGERVPLTKGKLQLQSESAEVYYRKIEIRPIERIPDEVLGL